jgi:ABC-2 type transport system ATP-binding protein
VAEGTPATLGGRDAENATLRFTLPASTTVSDLPAELSAAVASSADGLVELAVANPLPLLGALATWAAARGVELPDLAVFRPTLEDVYLRLTKQP